MNEVSILISPDRSEMVIPLFNREFTMVSAFVGVQSAKVYQGARLRNDQQFDLLEARLMDYSNFPTLVSWFAMTGPQTTQLINVAVNWMLGVAKGVSDMGHEGEQTISLFEANKAIEDDIKEYE